MPSRPRMKPIMSCRLLPGILGVCGPTSLRASISQTIVTSVYRAQAPYSTKGNPVLSHAREILPQPPNRWVADVRARIGKCISFGCSDAQVTRAAGVLGVLARKWRALSAGSEGFLTGGRRGLEDQQVVWGEMDSFGHVNNTTYIRYAESARVNWILHFAVQDPKNQDGWRELMRPKSIGLIMKSIKAEYKFPMTAPDRVSAYHKLRVRPEADHTSLFLDCVMFSHGHRRVVARTTEEVVIYDYREAKKTRLPGFALDLLRETWRGQETQMRRARETIWALLAEVEALEKETWDRIDAVEDLGGAVKA